MHVHSRPSHPDPPGRTRFVLLTLAVVLACNFTSSQLGLGWRSATAITFALAGWYLAYVWHHRDRYLAHILLFSLVAGWTELLADHWLVSVTGTLVYAQGGPFVWDSPLYMPFAWMVVTTQLGSIGWWLGRRWGLPTASALLGLIGAVNIPLYEQWAKGADWWSYRNAPMLGATPWYIIGGEFLIALSLPAAMALLEKKNLRLSLVAGAAQGLWIWGAYGLAFWLLA